MLLFFSNNFKFCAVKKNIYIYINFGKEVNDNNPKFKAGDHVKNIKMQKHCC